jgi:hypothetical protein
VQVLLLALLAGAKPAGYLGLTLPRKGGVAVGIIAVAVFVILVDGISWLLGRGIVTQIQLDIIGRRAPRAGCPGLVVVTPIGKEMLFRAFLFRGTARPATSGP